MIQERFTVKGRAYLFMWEDYGQHWRVLVGGAQIADGYSSDRYTARDAARSRIRRMQKREESAEGGVSA